MKGNELLKMSTQEQQEYVNNFKIGAYKSFIKARDILSRPGISFTQDQIEAINNLSKSEKQKAIIDILMGE